MPGMWSQDHRLGVESGIETMDLVLRAVSRPWTWCRERCRDHELGVESGIETMDLVLSLVSRPWTWCWAWSQDHGLGAKSGLNTIDLVLRAVSRPWTWCWERFRDHGLGAESGVETKSCGLAIVVGLGEFGFGLGLTLSLLHSEVSLSQVNSHNDHALLETAKGRVDSTYRYWNHRPWFRSWSRVLGRSPGLGFEILIFFVLPSSIHCKSSHRYLSLRTLPIISARVVLPHVPQSGEVWGHSSQYITLHSQD